VIWSPIDFHSAAEGVIAVRFSDINLATADHRNPSRGIRNVEFFVGLLQHDFNMLMFGNSIKSSLRVDAGGGDNSNLRRLLMLMFKENFDPTA